jgi:steroid delta-isomerase
MPTKDDVRALLERYCDAMSAHRREDWLDCFADDAVQEDPVGTEPNIGRDAIGRFFDSNDVPVRLSLTDEPLVIGREVLAFFEVVTDIDGKQMTIPRIVDHIVLTEDGARFQSLRAFFDYGEMVPVD